MIPRRARRFQQYHTPKRPKRPGGSSNFWPGRMHSIFRPPSRAWKYTYTPSKSGSEPFRTILRETFRQFRAVSSVSYLILQSIIWSIKYFEGILKYFNPGTKNTDTSRIILSIDTPPSIIRYLSKWYRYYNKLGQAPYDSAELNSPCIVGSVTQCVCLG